MSETLDVKQSWMQLSAVQVGGVICLPTLLVGHELVRVNGMGSALLSILYGNCFLFLIALVASFMSVTARKTTAENAKSYFGPLGMYFFSLIITLSFSAWFGIQTEVMSRDIMSLIGMESERPILLCLVLGFVMVGSVFFGIKGVTLLAAISLPLMVATLAFSLLSAGSRVAWAGPTESLFQNCTASGISLIIGTAIGAVIDLPTFFRFSKTKKDAAWASCITFLVALPLIEVVGVFLGYWSSAGSLVEALLSSNHSLFRLWVGFFILIAGWTTNTTNLYSAAMSMQASFPALSEKKGIFLVGALSVCLSLFPLLEKLSFVLDFMGVFIASMGGVVFTAYSLRRFGLSTGRQQLAWLIGALFGCLNLFLGFGFTSIAIIDAFMMSACSVVIALFFARMSQRRLVYET